MNRRSLLLMTAAVPISLMFQGVAGHPAAAQGTGTTPLVAVGLSGIADWEASQPFIDVFRQSREWMGRSDEEFVSHTNAELRAGGHLNDDGWPVSIPSDATAVGAIILCDLAAADTSMNGHYRMTWQGQGTIRINGTATNLTQGPGWAEFDYTTSDTGIVAVDIVEQHPTDPATNFCCINQSLQAAYDDGAVFRPVWLDLIRNFRVIRFMDWMATNDSPVSDWSDRPKLTSATWTFGVPIEVMVQLANELGIDPWFCFPHLATDEYISQLATYVRDNLNPQMVANFEFSNEVWNFQFGQTQWALQEAEALWPGQGDGWMQFYGGQAARMAMLLDAVYADAPDRYRKIITAHTAWIDLNQAALEAPLWVAQQAGRQPPGTYFDAYAVTGYFDGGIGRPENVATIQEWRGLGDADAFARMADQIIDGRHIAGEAGGTTITTLEQVWQSQKAIADAADLSLVMYEGGSHIVPDHAATEADPGLFDFLERFHYSPQMGEVYTRAMDGFAKVGGEYFNAFVEVAGPGRAGFWGARRHVLDDNPRWQAIANRG